MKKILIIGIFLFFSIGSYFLVSNIYREPTELDLDGNFDRVLNEVNSYGGSMIVSYDTETGEILSKRRGDKPRESGVLSITEEEYEKSNKDYPKGTFIVKSDTSPSESIEHITGGNN